MKMGAFVLAYHGCDREVGEALLAGKSEFRPSQNAHDWLGHGVYFWENNPRRAIEWAQFMANHSLFKDRVKNPYAVGAVIDLGNCLDLTESLSLALVKTAYDGLSRIFKSADNGLPKNIPVSSHDEDLLKRYLDCAVINHVHETTEEPFTTVRAAFHEGGELYPGAAIKAKTHIQLCVRNMTNIRGIFRIPDIELLTGNSL
jgi:hypothetical protein